MRAELRARMNGIRVSRGLAPGHLRWNWWGSGQGNVIDRDDELRQRAFSRGTGHVLPDLEAAQRGGTQQHRDGLAGFWAHPRVAVRGIAAASRLDVPAEGGGGEWMVGHAVVAGGAHGGR